jgi:hypothetical protein
MNKILLTIFSLILLLSLQHNKAWGQDCEQCINKNAKITFLGIDFSMLSFEGTLELKDHNSVINTYYPAWNDLFVKEAKKYDVVKYFGFPNVILDTDYFNKFNNKAKNINAKRLKAITIKDLNLHINNFRFDKINTPYAIYLIAINFNKEKALATYYIVLMDIKTNNILGLKEVVSKPSGFGFRSYWSGSVNNAIQQVDKKIKKWFI